MGKRKSFVVSASLSIPTMPAFLPPTCIAAAAYLIFLDAMHVRIVLTAQKRHALTACPIHHAIKGRVPTTRPLPVRAHLFCSFHVFMELFLLKCQEILF